MTILQTTVAACGSDDGLLNFVDEGVSALQAEGQEPRYVLLGPDAYGPFCRAVAARFGRSEGAFESYQWLSVVLDPFRSGEVCVVPAPGALAAGVRGEQR